MSVHQNGPTCTGCDQKISQCNPTIQNWWFRLKQKHPECHVAWGWRGKADQDLFVAQGRSKAVWPTSRHNVTKADGTPNSEALDLFQIIDGKEVWSPKFYFELAQWVIAEKDPIEWAGNWKTFHESDHFQLDRNKMGPA